MKVSTDRIVGKRAIISSKMVAKVGRIEVKMEYDSNAASHQSGSVYLLAAHGQKVVYLRHKIYPIFICVRIRASF